MKIENLTIEGMSCNHCVMALKKELAQSKITVLEAAVGSARIEYDEHVIPSEKIADVVAEAGYKLVKAAPVL